MSEEQKREVVEVDVKAVNGLIGAVIDQGQVPIEFRNVYHTSVVLALLLEDTPVGENCNNIAEQLARFIRKMGLEIGGFDQLAEITQFYHGRLQAELKAIQEGANKG